MITLSNDGLDLPGGPAENLQMVTHMEVFGLHLATYTDLKVN